ncbi:MAG: dihydrodipicolinate synthase family protein [Planctomycetota bacterium]
MAMPDPLKLLTPNRKITGYSATLLPVQNGSVDWGGFDLLVEETFDSGLTPAINMDTGYGNLIDDATRQRALEHTRRIASGRDFVGGVFVGDMPDAAFDCDAYRRGIAEVVSFDATPILFQSYGLAHQVDEEIVANYESATVDCDSFYAFELGTMFAPFGKIYSIQVYEQLVNLPKCLGAKHSSLSRVLEWERIELRNRIRPEFKVMTGNDLAIDMVMYGSDYLLGLSTFAPDAFARRDAMWEAGDAGFYELNDLLQYLGAFAFRPHVPAYKHDAAMFLCLRGKIASDETYPGAPERPSTDREVLQHLVDDINRSVT